MKTYQVPLEKRLLNIVIGIVIIICFLPYYEVGLIELKYFSIVLGFGMFYFLRAYYKNRYRIELNNEGINVYYQFFRFKHLGWQDIESINSSRPLWGNPYLYLIYLEKGKRKRFNLESMISPELVRDIYQYKNFPYPKRIERYLKKSEKKTRPKKFIARSIEYLLGLGYLCMAIVAGYIYRRTIPYGPGAFENLAYLGIIWYLGILLTIIAAVFQKRYAVKKSKLIAGYGSLLLLVAFTFNQIVFASQEIWFYVSVSIIIIVSLWLFLISILKDNRLAITTAKTVYFSAGIIFIILSFSPLWFIPKPSIRTMGTIYGKYPIDCSATWSPDGEKIIINARPDVENQYFYFISPPTRIIEKSAMQDEQNQPFSFYYNDINRLFWSPDHSKLITYGYSNAGGPQYYLFNLATQKWRALKNLCDPNLQNYNTRFYQGFCQPWSPDSRALVISQSQDSSKTTKAIDYLYLYSIPDTTKTLLVQSEEKIAAYFWKKDTTLVYLTYKELGRIIEHNAYHYYQTYTVSVLHPKFNTATKQWEHILPPEKCYATGELWRNYMFSPSGQYLLLALDSVTSNGVNYYILNTNTFSRVSLPGIPAYTSWNRIAWHPIEDRLVYCINTLGHDDIMEFDVKTKISHRITSETGWISNIFYSSLGNRLVYTVYPIDITNTGAIVSIKTDGTDWRRVMPSIISANFKVVDFPYAWQPGKNNLAVLLAPYRLGDKRPINVYIATLN